jgi:hypothetical protein
MILYQKLISRVDLKNNPTTLYVFGDNIVRVGFGGQAAEMRGEPNAVGIPTKLSPNQFFSNSESDLKRFLDHSEESFSRLKGHSGITIFPSDGIGTGLARLRIKAPKIADLLKERLLELGINEHFCP